MHNRGKLKLKPRSDGFDHDRATAVPPARPYCRDLGERIKRGVASLDPLLRPLAPAVLHRHLQDLVELFIARWVGGWVGSNREATAW